MEQVTRGYIEIGHGSARGKYRATLLASGFIHTDINDSPSWDSSLTIHISQCVIGAEVSQDPITNPTPVWWPEQGKHSLRGYSPSLDSDYNEGLVKGLEKVGFGEFIPDGVIVESHGGDSNNEQALTRYLYRGEVIYQFCRTCRSSFCKCPGVMKYCGY